MPALHGPLRFGPASAPPATAPAALGTPAASDAAAGPGRASLAGGLLLLLAAWLITRPDLGITHDAELYMAQALSWLHPERFADDLYFAFGSQDGFTLSSALYAPLVQWLGPPAAHRLATLLGQGLWLGGLLFLLGGLFAPARLVLLAAAGAILLSPVYGSMHIFRYGEAFTTPRLFAEAGVLFALGFALRGRWLAAVAALAGAASLHPLMTLPGAAVAFLLAARRDRRAWLLPVAGGALFLGLAAAGVDPFARALAAFDPAWWAIVRERNHFVFLGGWRLLDLLQVLPVLCLGAMAWRVAAPAERPLLLAAGMVALGGLAATLLGADLAGNVLVTNLQTWRALWVFTLLANAWAAVIALRLPRGGLARRMLLLALALSVAERFVSFPAMFAPPLFLAALLAQVAEARRPASLPAALRGLALALAALMGLAVLFVLGVLVHHQVTDGEAAYTLVGGAVLAAATALLATLAAPDGGRTARLLPLLGAALLLVAATVADRRGAWQRFATDEAIPADLAAFLEGTGTLYWDGGLPLVWMKLRRASFYSCMQGSGLLFYRGTALEYDRRATGLIGLNTADFGVSSGGMCRRRPAPEEDGPRSAAQLRAACEALPELDALVLTVGLPEAPHRVWRPPVPFRRLTAEGRAGDFDSLYLYRCADLRRPPGA